LKKSSRERLDFLDNHVPIGNEPAVNAGDYLIARPCVRIEKAPVGSQPALHNPLQVFREF